MYTIQFFLELLWLVQVGVAIFKITIAKLSTGNAGKNCKVRHTQNKKVKHVHSHRLFLMGVYNLLFYLEAFLKLGKTYSQLVQAQTSYL